VTTVEGFADLATVGEAMAAGELGHRTIEAMVHPGSAGYDQETSLLSNSLALRARGGVELVNYRVVVAGRGAR
jgi:2-keto-3-deoxy-6-phosphogluconate aldolase